MQSYPKYEKHFYKEDNVCMKWTKQKFMEENQFDIHGRKMKAKLWVSLTERLISNAACRSLLIKWKAR